MSVIKIGISACLLGHNVRFNGSNCHKKWLTKDWSKHFDYKIFCPEVAAGLGVPRKSMLIMADPQESHLKLVTRDDPKTELTSLISKASQQILESCDDINGFIVKRGSPSCGSGSAKLYNEKLNVKSHRQDGLFIQTLKTRFPYLPIEDEGRLNDSAIREHFIKQVGLYHAAKVMLKTVSKISDLEAFHTRNKMMLQLHHPNNQKLLGHLIANWNKQKNLEAIKQQYFDLFVSSFGNIATPARHYSLMQRCFREINRHLDKCCRADIQEMLLAYLKDLVPLATPMAILRHYAKRYQQSFIVHQSYLYPYPDELGLMKGV